MKSQIDAYKKAVQNLKTATKNMDKIVGPKLEQLYRNRDVNGLFCLIKILPEGYHGRERCFQAILEIKRPDERGVTEPPLGSCST